MEQNGCSAESNQRRRPFHADACCRSTTSSRKIVDSFLCLLFWPVLSDSFGGPEECQNIFLIITPKNNRKKFLLISWRMPRSNSTRMEITGITWMWRLPLMNKRKSWKDFWKSKSSFSFFFVCCLWGYTSSGSV